MNKKYTVLIVDDNPQNIQVMARIVEECGCEVGFAQDGKQALEFLTLIRPALILLDIMMPEMDGFETCRRIKEDSELKDIPIIFITAKSEKDDILKGLEVGGVDYITKPFNTAELKMRIKIQLKMRKQLDEIQTINCQLEILNNKLRISNEELERTASTDQLTGAWNRRYFANVVAAQMERARRYNQNTSLLLMDIDHFKNVNDKFGHQIGDEVLIDFSKLVQENIRSADFLTRWGGEEFMILAPCLEACHVKQMAEKLRLIVQNHQFKDAGSITISIGVAQYQTNDNLDSWIKRADDALYQAKEDGRNRVVYNIDAMETS